MANPVPGHSVSTAYGKSGGWSCGWHTGVDIAAPKGTAVVASIAGQIRHRNYGGDLGNHQFAISPDPGQPFADGEVFYAHTYDRPPDGVYVSIGDLVAHVGVEGNTTGPHLHYEYHPEEKNSWGCNVCANPQPTLDHQGQVSAQEMEDDMFVIVSPNRPSLLCGPGYSKELSEEEAGVMSDCGVRRVSHNDRGWDVARAACTHGDATD